MLERAIADTPVVAELMRDARRGSGRCGSRRTSPTAPRPTPATAGSWPATPARSSTRSSRPASRSPSSRGSRPPRELDRARDAGRLLHPPLRAPSRAVSERRFETFRRFVVGFYTPAVPRSLLLVRSRRHRIFRAVVTVLAGNWQPRLWTRTAESDLLRLRRAAEALLDLSTRLVPPRRRRRLSDRRRCVSPAAVATPAGARCRASSDSSSTPSVSRGSTPESIGDDQPLFGERPGPRLDRRARARGGDRARVLGRDSGRQGRSRGLPLRPHAGALARRTPRRGDGRESTGSDRGRAAGS